MPEESHYSINVAKKAPSLGWNGKPVYAHHFRVNIIHRDDAVVVLAELRSKFKSPKYEIEMAHWENIGYPVNEKGERS